MFKQLFAKLVGMFTREPAEEKFYISARALRELILEILGKNPTYSAKQVLDEVLNLGYFSTLPRVTRILKRIAKQSKRTGLKYPARGRPTIPPETQNLITKLALEYPKLSARQTAIEISKLGHPCSTITIYKYRKIARKNGARLELNVLSQAPATVKIRKWKRNRKNYTKIRELVKKIALENPTFKPTKICDELLKCGYIVARQTVALYTHQARNTVPAKTYTNRVFRIPVEEKMRIEKIALEHPEWSGAQIFNALSLAGFAYSERTVFRYMYLARSKGTSEQRGPLNEGQKLVTKFAIENPAWERRKILAKVFQLGYVMSMEDVARHIRLARNQSLTRESI